jgi:nitrite reductase/ring-hydroxylating ferredoxin subunit
MPWVDVAAAEQVARAGMLETEARGAALLLYNVAGAIYATAAICPHHAAWFSQGGMDGEYVDCPRHQGRFHIPTGRRVRGPECSDLRTYPTSVSGGRVLVWID